MRYFIFILSSLVAVLILLYHDSRQKPVPPSFSYARYGLNKVAEGKNDPSKLQEAIELLYEALRMDPKDPLALFGMGWALQLKGADSEAVDYYEQALDQLDELRGYTTHNLNLIDEKEDQSPEFTMDLE